MSEYVDIKWCDWCVADSGRTHATRACCIARRVSKMVPHLRMGALNDVAGSRGADVGHQFRMAVLRSVSMRVAKLAKDARMAAYRRLMQAGWLPDDLEAVKRMAMEEFRKGQADGC